MSLYEKIVDHLKNLFAAFPLTKKKYKRNISKIRSTPSSGRRSPKPRPAGIPRSQPKKKTASPSPVKRRKDGPSASRSSAGKAAAKKKQPKKKTGRVRQKEPGMKKPATSQQNKISRKPLTSRRKDTRSSPGTPNRGRPNIQSKAKPTIRHQRPASSKSKTQKAQAGKYIGAITHYFSRINVVVLKMENGPLRLGDDIEIRGKSTNFKQPVESLQVESFDVKMAKKNQLVGLKVLNKVVVGDQVFKI